MQRMWEMNTSGKWGAPSFSLSITYAVRKCQWGKWEGCIIRECRVSFSLLWIVLHFSVLVCATYESQIYVFVKLGAKMCMEKEMTLICDIFMVISWICGSWRVPNATNDLYRVFLNQYVKRVCAFIRHVWCLILCRLVTQGSLFLYIDLVGSRLLH